MVWDLEHCKQTVLKYYGDGSFGSTRFPQKKCELLFVIEPVIHTFFGKLSLGFWVTMIKIDTAGARFPNSIEITDSLRKIKSVS